MGHRLKERRMAGETSPLEIVEALAEAINRHDVDAIMQHLHEGHVFVDSLGNEVRGAQAVRKAWEQYLSMVPDYWVRIEHGVLAPEYIALFGKAGGTLAVEGETPPENWWETTAAWRAVIADGRVAEWQVYSDNEPIRKLMKKKAPVRGKKSKSAKTKKTKPKKTKPKKKK
jgi:limonene-1,2-epoxide hydrolase